MRVNLADGEKRNFWVNKGSEGCFFAQVQDVRLILQDCKESRDVQTKNSRSKNWHRVCSVPTILIEKWINEGKLTNKFYKDPDQQLKLQQLVLKEAPMFMCTEKELGITRRNTPKALIATPPLYKIEEGRSEKIIQ